MLAHLQVGIGMGSCMLLAEELRLPRRLGRGLQRPGKLPGAPT